MEDPFFICSHWNNKDSPDPLICSVACRKASKKAKVPVIQAARATSAAPTYFKHVNLLDSLLVDGGYGFTNNPSHAAFDHYFFDEVHNYRHIRMVNIGTGTAPKRPENWQPPRSFTYYIPLISGAARLAVDCAHVVTNSEKVGRQMYVLAKTSDTFDFERFSVDRGEMHQISLFEYKAIDSIEKTTDEYLRDGQVLRRLEDFAEQLAETCRSRREQEKAGTKQQVTVTTTIASEPGIRPPATPHFTVSTPPGDDTQTTELHLATDATSTTVPELTYDSARESIEPPRTPVGDEQGLHEQQKAEQIKARHGHEGGGFGTFLASSLGFLRGRQH